MISTRARYETVVAKVADRVAAGLTQVEPGLRAGRASSLLALLSGGVTLARSLDAANSRAKLAADLRSSARIVAGLND